MKNKRKKASPQPNVKALTIRTSKYFRRCTAQPRSAVSTTTKPEIRLFAAAATNASVPFVAEGSVNSADSGHEEDEDDDEEDEEQEEAEEEDDDDERQQQQQQQGDSSASDTEGSSRGSEAEDDDDNNNVNSSTTEKKEKKEKGVKGVKREPSAEIEDPQPPEKRIKQEQQQQQQGGEERLLDLAEVLRGKRFDRTLGVFVEEEKPASESKDKSLLQADTYSRPQLAPSPFEPDAVWSSPAAFNKMAPLDLECKH